MQNPITGQTPSINCVGKELRRAIEEPLVLEWRGHSSTFELLWNSGLVKGICFNPENTIYLAEETPLQEIHFLKRELPVKVVQL